MMKFNAVAWFTRRVSGRMSVSSTDEGRESLFADSAPEAARAWRDRLSTDEQGYIWKVLVWAPVPSKERRNYEVYSGPTVVYLWQDYQLVEAEQREDPMCNDYRYRLGLEAIRDAFSHQLIRLRFDKDRAPNLEPKDDIWPTDRVPIIRAAADGDCAELAVIGWGFPSTAQNRPPVINFRSDGRQFTAGRCLIPADGFYEFTAQDPPAPKSAKKSKWLFTKAGEDLFCIAGLWRDSHGTPAFTMLTMEPGPDLAGIHDRQIVILERKDWVAWLDPAVPSKDLIRPLPAGTLERVRVR